MKKALHTVRRHVSHHLSAAGKHVRNHLIPHEDNHHHPHLLAHRALVGYSVLLILTKVFLIVGSVALPSSSLYSSSITTANIVDLTNAARRDAGLTPLSVSAQLSAAAVAKAADMLANQYFSHTSPAGVTPWEWLRQAAYAYAFAGENLAVHYATAEDVQSGWMASPAHRANIVSPNFSEIGIGIATGEFEGVPSTVVVQMFGRPLNSVPELAIELPNPPAPEPKVAAAGAPSAPAPVIHEAATKVRPQPAAYAVEVPISYAEQATAYLNAEPTALTRVAETNVWEGTVRYNPSLLASDSEPLTVVASGETGSTVSHALALVAPGSGTREFYHFNSGGEREVKLLGMRVTNLNDSVRQFYLYFIVALATALLINIFVKIRIQRVGVIGHTTAVIALAVVLLGV